MKENYFWFALANYYFFLALAVTRQPYFLGVALPLFITIPSLSGVELVPGMQDSLEAQIETLKTQLYLDSKNYYD